MAAGPELVGKGHRPFPTKGLHAGQGSIACAKVTLSYMRRVISEAHVPGNDEIGFCSVLCGGRNSVKPPKPMAFRQTEDPLHSSGSFFLRFY